MGSNTKLNCLSYYILTFKLVSKMPNSAKPISLKDNREGFKKKSPLIIYLKVKPGYVIKQVEEKKQRK